MRSQRVDGRVISQFFAIVFCIADGTQQCLGLRLLHVGSTANKKRSSGASVLSCHPCSLGPLMFGTQQNSFHVQGYLGIVPVKCLTEAGNHRPAPIVAMGPLVSAFCLGCLGFGRHLTKLQNHSHRRLDLAKIVEHHGLHPGRPPVTHQ